MPTITPIAYNTGSPIPGTTQYGDLAVGTGAQDYGAFPSGYRFWATPDQEVGYVIAKPVPAGNQPNSLSIPAYVGFNRTQTLDEGQFVALANAVTNNSFSTGSQAKTWLESNGYWTSYASGPSLLASFDASNPSSYPGTGTTWFDISGNGNDGGIVGATFSSGGVGGTFNFSGSNQYVTIGAPIPNASSYSVAAWVNAASVAGAHNIVSSNSSPFWVNAGTLYGGTTGNYTWVSSGGFPTGLWKYVAYTFDDANNTATLYINGSQVNQNLSATSTYASEPTYIGSHFAGSPVSFWNGQIAEVRIWNGPLSGAGVLADYNSTKTRFGL